MASSVVRMVVRSNSEAHGVLQPIYHGRSFIGVSLALQFTCAIAKSNILQTIHDNIRITYIRSYRNYISSPSTNTEQIYVIVIENCCWELCVKYWCLQLHEWIARLMTLQWMISCGKWVEAHHVRTTMQSMCSPALQHADAHHVQCTPSCTPAHHVAPN